MNRRGVSIGGGALLFVLALLFFLAGFIVGAVLKYG